MPYYDSPEALSAFAMPDVRTYAYIAASASQLLSNEVAAAATVAVYYSHPSWPEERSRDLRSAQLLDALATQVGRNEVTTGFAELQVQGLAKEAAERLTATQLN